MNKARNIFELWNLQRIYICFKAWAHARETRARTHERSVCARSLNLHKFLQIAIINRLKITKCNKSGMIRSTMRPDPAKCKVEFTKIRFFVFFLFTIRYISNIYIIFASVFRECSKSATKIQQFINTNK